MTDQPKRAATTISRKKYEELQKDRDFQRRLFEGELEAKTAAKRELADARDEAANWSKMAEEWKHRANEAEVRASRAEGYASALLDKVYAPRPELPWERPQRVDQWGNPL